MGPIEVDRSRTIVVAIALLALALAYLDAQGRANAGNAAAAGPDASLERSDRATAVEAAVARTNLVADMAAALGADFGGVWFDPATTRVHVGVTSPASRSNAEAVAAQAGLSGSVTETSVASTVAELEAAQERWGKMVSDLFARGEVGTWLSLRDNAVTVELGSSVPPLRRSELERAAAEDPIRVLIRVSPRSSLYGIQASRCIKFEIRKAYCNPTIVAGVRIEDEASRGCTAGPPAILKKRGTVAKATATYLLTAGHCVQTGGAGKKWFAINKEGLPVGKKELGKGGAFVNAAIDVGVIETNTVYWTEAKDPPVVPTVAQWSAAAEHDPTTIKAQTEPMEGGKTCFSGQRSGKVCGQIEGTNVKFLFKGEPVETEKLVKVKLTGKGGIGDSGSPFYTEGAPSSVEGTFVGFEFEEGKGEEEGSVVFFHSLKTGFETLENEKGLSLELLTESNQQRHKKFKGGKYPVTIHGSTTAAHKFTTEGGTVECKENSFHGVLSAASSTLTLTPVHKACFGLGFATTVETAGCTYVLHATEKASPENYKASFDVSCVAGKSIKFTAGACKWEVQNQGDREAVDLIDDTAATPKRDVTMKPTVGPLAYTVTQDGVGCPFGGIGPKFGSYISTENVTLTGQSTTAPAEKIDFEVADE